MDYFKEDPESYARIQDVRRNAKINYDLPPNIMVLKRRRGVIDLPLDKAAYREIQDGGGEPEILDIDVGKPVMKKPPAKTVKQALRQYEEEKVTAQILRGLADWLCENFIFIYISGLALYLYQDGKYVHFRFDFATRFLMQVFKECAINYPLRSADYKELVRLIQAQPQIEKKQEDCRTDQTCILYSDGVFVAEGEGRMCRPHPRDYQFSKIDYALKWGYEYVASTEARIFIERFCNYDEVREAYLWELIGYLLSSYQQKIIVIFMGPSNSGKSTLANMVRRICGTEACVAMGIKELSGNFSLAELQGKRLCVDSEMDATTLNARDISLLKKVVGNDLLQGNRKHEQQFYFQCQTKFLLCTNNKIKFRSDEDTVSLFNRMKIFKLEESIPQEEQIYDMDLILDENRTYFLQQAMKGLLRLVSNNFQFSYHEAPENYVENVNRPADLFNVDQFVKVCCQCGEDFEESVTDLYNAYKQFAADNNMKEVSVKSFSCRLVNCYDIFRKRTSSNRFFKGIRLMTHDT